MKLFYTFIFPTIILASLSCKTKLATNDKSDKAIPVEIKITRTHSHCGGMAPTPQMLENARKQKPFATTVYLKKGSVNELNTPIYKTLSSNSDGIIELDLEPGDYFIVREDKKDKQTFEDYVKGRNSDQNIYYEGFTRACYLEYFKKPDLSFTVSDTSTQFHRNFHKGCYNKPCENYIGPYPP